MNLFFVVVVIVFVVLVLAVVGYRLFALTPFAHHTDHYRDPGTGKRRFESPHLETWDEFEQRTHDNLN
jgi:hypothetical protein